MKSLLTTTLLAFSFSTSAAVIQLAQQATGVSSVRHTETKSVGNAIHEIQFNINQLVAEPSMAHPKYTLLSEQNIAFSKNLGEARLPYKSLVVQGAPEEIEVVIDEQDEVIVPVLSVPGQPEDCRCASKQNKWLELTSAPNSLYKVESLGSYRGQALSRVTIYAAATDLERSETKFYPHLRAQITSPASLDSVFADQLDAAYDYLIVTPKALLDGLSDFVAYKSSKGLRIKTETVENIGGTVAALTAYFKSEYQSSRYKYALIVGTDDLVPNHKVSTSGSSQTPSDYPYFLMDSNDIVPDVQYGRVVASTVQEVARQTGKWMRYENHAYELGQYLKMIGIASNEGSNPSDNEYVTGMENDLKGAFGTVASHFYQNDATSKPQNINDAFNKGSSFLVYLGHGSGTSWASTGQTYAVSHIKQINNANVLMPFVLDVACQNGILKKNYFGETFMNATNSKGEGIGASMYLGGSVNISWHPPAIMARGFVKKTIANGLNKIGDAILAGHLYLMENHSEIEEVKDNFEWYHLFGEPSAPIYFK